VKQFGFPLDLSLVPGPSLLTLEKSCKSQLRLELEDYVYFLEGKNDRANFVNYSAFIAKIFESDILYLENNVCCKIKMCVNTVYR